MERIVSWAKAHPVEAGLAGVLAFVVLLYVLRAFGGGSQSSGGGGDPTAAAYYAAQATTAQSGDALQAVQIQAQAATAQDQINASASVLNNQNWAATDLAETQSNNAAALGVAKIQGYTEIKIAPYQLQQSLYNVLGAVASQPGSTVSQSDSGFFGLGASSSTSYVPNPAAVMASGDLQSLITNGLYAHH